MNHPYIHIKETKTFGRGIYSNRNIPKNIVIEINPLIVLSKTHTNIAKNTCLNNYFYYYDQNKCAIALGHGSLFNHNSIPNVTYEIDKKTNTVKFITLVEVLKNQQLFIDYGYNPISSND